MVARQPPVHLFWTAAWGGALLIVVVFSISATLSSAKEIYSYLDEEGNIVATDDLGAIPKKYREKVRVTDRTERIPSGEQVAQPPGGETFTGILATIMKWIPDPTISGLSNQQSFWLIGGFLVGAFAAGSLMFSRNPSVKFAMKWVLLFAVVGVAYALSVAELGPLESAKHNGAGGDSQGLFQRMRGEVQDIEEGQRNRVSDIDQLGQ